MFYESALLGPRLGRVLLLPSDLSRGRVIVVNFKALCSSEEGSENA